jgi:hypothetical protein
MQLEIGVVDTPQQWQPAAKRKSKERRPKKEHEKHLHPIARGRLQQMHVRSRCAEVCVRV